MSNVMQLPRFTKTAKQVKKRKQLFVGNKPAGGVLLTKAPGWELYHLPERSRNGWESLKLISTDEIPTKANYWLGWNGKRFSNNEEINSLIENNPALSRIVLSVIEKKFSA